MLATSEIFSPSLTAKLGYINFKYTQNPISVELMIFDKKTLFISTKEESNLNKMRWLCTNNPFIVEMANSYFENLWSTATKETEDNPLCRKNNNSACAPKKHPYPRLAMHNRHATRSFNSHKTRKARTNKGNNKADIKLTRKHQFSNTLARIAPIGWRLLLTQKNFNLNPAVISKRCPHMKNKPIKQSEGTRTRGLTPALGA